MPALDTAGVFVALRGLGNVAKRFVALVDALIDMQIEVQRTLRGESKDVVEHVVNVGNHEQYGADDPTGFGDEVNDCVALAVAKLFDHQEIDAFQIDAAAPILAQLAEHAPARCRLILRRLQMCPYRPGSVRIAGSKPKLHAGAEVGGGPARIAVAGNRIDSGPQ